eukprot:TRINITY_DN4253_c0_g1_i6.p1 TRINITY_DN4253_c0_g1~~TRINITY_DN4253_c0_g1_i6.p1  ORF type:complete len:534 (-),score=105.83 TRINITY_DN4253_c0_g1_i6:1925-3526(-)
MATKPGQPAVEEADFWIKAKNYYAKEGPKIRFLLVYVAANMAVFFDTYVSYVSAEEGLLKIQYEALGQGVAIAKSCGALLRLNAGIMILLPVLRNALLWLRETPVNDWIPIDSNISFHKRVAYWIAILSAVHTGAHIYNFKELETKTLDELKEITYNYPHDERLNFTQYLYTTLPGLTGVLLVLTMIIMYSAAHEKIRRPYFESFWYSHHLFILFFGLTIIHGMGEYVGATAYWYWFLGPGVLYAFERGLRWYRGKQSTILVDAIAHPSSVVEVRFQKPSFDYRPGMYLFLNCPYIYQHEWHPFTITSCPSDAYVSVHIRMIGDWTKELGQLLLKSEHRESILQTSSMNGQPILEVDGPFGSAADNIYDFQVVLLCGAGIGVTPFASILKDIHHKIKIIGNCPIKKVKFVWINRDKEAFEWFSDILNELEHENVNNFLEINTFLTGGLKTDDIRVLMYHENASSDAITGLESATNFGRPNFNKIFADLKQQYPGERVGVFFCGPRVLARELHACSRKYTTHDGTKFVFHKENF